MKQFLTKVPKVALFGLLSGALLLPAQAVEAQVQFAGNTYGCFYTDAGTPCTPATGAMYAYQSDVMLPGLTYHNSQFNDFAVPAGGGSLFVGFGGNGVNGPGNVNNFGSFNLTDQIATYSGFFALRIFFTIPDVTPPDMVFSSVVFGSVVSIPGSGPAGGVQITWNDPIWNFAFENGTNGAAGMATLQLNNVSVNHGQTASITGNITATVPEPASMILLGSGLAGLVGVARRRRRQKDNDSDV